MARTSAEAVAAEQWLAGVGVVRGGPDSWVDPEEPGVALNSFDVAHDWVVRMFKDERLTAREQIRLGYGFVDLLDDYGVAVQLHWCARRQSSAELTEWFWAEYRNRLAEPEEPRALSYCMSVDWLEDRKTAVPAFEALLADDLERLEHLDGEAREGTVRRISRVLSASGNVPWCVAVQVYRKASNFPALHRSILSGVFGAFFSSFYADLDPAEAHALLLTLDLPADIEYLEELMANLAAGYCHRSCVPE
jgi:hypothetical protein